MAPSTTSLAPAEQLIPVPDAQAEASLPPDPTDAERQAAGATLRVARWSARHPWSAMGAWVAFVVVCLVVGGMVGVRQLAPSESGSGESALADAAIEAGQFPTVVTEQVIISDRDGPLDPQRGAAAVAALQAAYADVPEIVDVGDPIPSADGTAVLVPITLDDGGNAGEDAILHATEHIAPVHI